MRHDTWGALSIVSWALACMNYQVPRIALAMGAIGAVTLVIFLFGRKENKMEV